MDFTKFLNSKDIATYFRRIRYEFTPEQAMYVIHASAERTLPEKHAAYRELIGAYPDHALRERRQGVFKGETVASFLRTYMERENALLAEFKREGSDAVCTYDLFSVSGDGGERDEAFLHAFELDVGQDLDALQVRRYPRARSPEQVGTPHAGRLRQGALCPRRDPKTK